MRRALVLAFGAALVVGVSGAGAGHAPQIDPLTVPVGLLASHNDVSSFQISPIAETVKDHRADVFVQHIRVAPDGALPWHFHPGPAIVTVVRGSLGFQREVHGECVTTWYAAGTGLMVPTGQVERALGGADGFDVYVTFVTPTGTPNQTILAATPHACS